VQKLLERLEQRECVRRRRRGRVNEYAPRVARDDLIRHGLRDVADRLCDGSLTPLLTQLVQARPLTEDELAELRALVRRLDDEEGPS
jgi:predicted transcriptional regulator